jgi:hypothetical protein
MFEWHERYISGQPAERVLECTYELLLGQYQVTLELVGGLQTMHVLQSIAPLKEVRIESHWQTAEMLGRLWCKQFGAEFTETLLEQARVAVEIGYAVVRMALEEDRMLPDTTLREGSAALRLYLETIMRSAGMKLE